MGEPRQQTVLKVLFAKSLLEQDRQQEHLRGGWNLLPSQVPRRTPIHTRNIVLGEENFTPNFREG